MLFLARIDAEGAPCKKKKKKQTRSARANTKRAHNGGRGRLGLLFTRAGARSVGAPLPLGHHRRTLFFFLARVQQPAKEPRTCCCRLLPRPSQGAAAAPPAPAQREHEVQHAAGLDVELLRLLVVGELLAAEDEALLGGRDACGLRGGGRGGGKRGGGRLAGRARLSALLGSGAPLWVPLLWRANAANTNGSPSTCSMRSLMRSTLSLGSMSSSSVLPVSVFTLIIILPEGRGGGRIGRVAGAALGLVVSC